MKTVTLKVNQKLPLYLSVRDDKGDQVAKKEGDTPAVWGVSDLSLATIEPAVDGRSAVVVPVGPEGTVRVTVTTTVNFGVGKDDQTLVDEWEIDLVKAARIVVGDPIDM